MTFGDVYFPFFRSFALNRTQKVKKKENVALFTMSLVYLQFKTGMEIIGSLGYQIN
jgi:hypothetical protein